MIKYEQINSNLIIIMKKYLIAIAPFLIGLTCFVSYKIIGSKVMPDGTLIEPFGLIPLTFIFLFLSIIGTIVILVKSIRNK